MGGRQAREQESALLPTVSRGATLLAVAGEGRPGARGSEERVSSVRVDRPDSHAPQSNGNSPSPGLDECLDFVRFCYRRRRVAWPELYDEMCLVAARGSYRGLGYAELAERGISFCLTDLARLAALTQRVLLEERSSPEPGRSESAAAMMLVAQHAQG
ncbi:hypothetical protein BH23CHL7_BH23CHL7_08810 [soil metagenome]